MRKNRIFENKRFRFCLAYVTPGVKKISPFDPADWSPLTNIYTCLAINITNIYTHI